MNKNLKFVPTTLLAGFFCYKIFESWISYIVSETWLELIERTSCYIFGSSYISLDSGDIKTVQSYCSKVELKKQ